MNKEHICFTKKLEKITKEKVHAIYGDVYAKRKKIEAFLHKEKTKKQIQIDELEKYDVALFQVHSLPIPNEFQDYGLSDIMVDFEIDNDEGVVIAKKLYRLFGEYEIETRTYILDNYGRTWRAWAALPTRKAARRWD